MEKTHVDAIGGVPIALVAGVKMTWDRLDQKGKDTMVDAATWPPDYLVPEWLRPQVHALLTESGERMHQATAEAIVIISERE